MKLTYKKFVMRMVDHNISGRSIGKLTGIPHSTACNLVKSEKLFKKYREQIESVWGCLWMLQIPKEQLILKLWRRS